MLYRLLQSLQSRPRLRLLRLKNLLHMLQLPMLQCRRTNMQLQLLQRLELDCMPATLGGEN